MSQRLINIGSGPNTKDGDTVRHAFELVNQNFTDLYGAVEILGGPGGSGNIVAVNIKGDIYAANDTLAFDSITGKFTVSTVADEVPLRYQFRANFTQNGGLDILMDLPPGWTYTKSNNKATITHHTGRMPTFVSYWGYSLVDGLRMRFPTAGYQATQATGTLTLDLNSAVTGADVGQYALVTVLF